VQSGEISGSAGGLVLWPAKVLLPVGFVLLAFQGFSELVKRIAFLRGAGPDPTEKVEAKSAEELLAEEIRRQRGELE
jgi:TRAP-type mannitol/chloroaromatic compound transport system permease small subunit